MVMLTGLDRVIAGADLPYTKQSGADTRTAHRGGLREVKGVIWHTTETADSAFRSGRTAPTLAYVTRQTSYNILIGRDGHVYIIASGTAAHAGRGSGHGFTRDDANRESIGVSFDANSSNHPVTAAQLDAGARLGAALDQEWKGNLRHVMHGEWAPGRRSDPTQVPGGWAALRAAIKRGSWGDTDNTTAPSKPSTSTASSGSSASKVWPHAQLAVTSRHTTASHRAWVAMLAGVGFKDKRLTLAIQKWLQWNGYYKGYRLDGQFGPATARALQQFLKAKGFYKGVIDGDRGPLTIQAEIRYINSQAKHYR